MPWVKLSNEDGQFWDREVGFHLRRGEIKELPDPLPPGSDTATYLRLGGFVFCLRPGWILDPDATVNDDVMLSEQNDEESIPADEISPRGRNDKPVRRDDIPLTGPEAPEVEPPVVKPRQKKTIKMAPSKTSKK